MANRVSPSKLFENDGTGKFTDVSDAKNINLRVLAYNANWGDLDQDGFQDLFITTLGKNYILWNHRAHHFEVDSTILPENKYSYSTGSVLADLDRDGDLDIVVANYYMGSSRIYENLGNEKNYLQVSLRGKVSNSRGIGARLWLYEKGHLGSPEFLKGVRVISTDAGYCSSGLPVAYWGVNGTNKFDLLIQFPSGIQKTIHSIQAGKSYALQEPSDIKADLNYPLHLTMNLIFNKKYRLITFRILVFVFLVVILNIYIYYHTYWPVIHLLFFNTSLITLFTLFCYLISPRSEWYFWSFPFYVTILFAGFMYFLINKYTVIRYLPEQKLELLDLLRQFNHNHSGMKQIDHLLFYCNNPVYLKAGSKIREDFFHELNYFKTYTLPGAQKIIHRARRMQLHELKLISKMARLRKLSRMVTNKFSASNFKVSHLAHLKAQLATMKRDIHDIRNVTDRYNSSELLQEISKVLVKFPQFTEISVQKPSDIKRVWVIAWREEIVQILDSLFQNALDAMQNLPHKRIQIIINEPEFNRIKLLIRDFGVGILQDIQNQIFEEDFSTKNSTGVGLYHAAKILETFGGHISLLHSEKNYGTTFQIIMKVLRYEKETNSDD